MPGKILGLDIGKDSVAAVQVKSGLRRYQITACARVRFEENGGIGGALDKLFHESDLRSDTCFTCLPGDFFSYRNLELPFKDPKKIRQTIPYEIETLIPFGAEDLIVDFTPTERSDPTEVLAASVKKSVLSEYLDHLKRCGIEPDAIDIRCIPTVSWLLRQAQTPNHGVFLDLGERSGTLVLYAEKRIVLVRAIPFGSPNPSGSGPGQDLPEAGESSPSEELEPRLEGLCKAVQNTIHAFEWQTKRTVQPEAIFISGMGVLNAEIPDLLRKYLDIPPTRVDLSRDAGILMDQAIVSAWEPALMDRALALALRDVKHGQGFNFRRGEFAKKTHYVGIQKQIRKVAVFVIIILALISADIGVDYYFENKRYHMLDERISEVFRQTFPGIKRMVDPVQQMKVKIREVKTSAVSVPGVSQGGKMVDILREISQRIPRSLDVHVDRMVVDPETVRIVGTTATFNTVDNIKNELGPSPYFDAVTISSANLDQKGKQVRFEIKLDRKQ